MQDGIQAEPGSPQFTSSLLERLRADPDVCPDGSLTLREMRASSRNTMVFRVSCGEMPLFCKAELSTRPSFVKDEHAMLLELQKRLAGAGVRSLTPVAAYPDLRVLVTREESGDSVRHYIDKALRAPEGSPARCFVEGLMERSAEALYRFHVAFGLRRDETGVERASSYMDFHPGNLLVTSRDERNPIIMMDPPPHEPPERPVHFDLGTFCFGIARAGFTPYAVARFPQRWLDDLKATFLAGYFRRLGRASRADDLEAIKASERARAASALRRYAEFHRFPNWPVEFFRMAYFSPVIGAYLTLHLPRSYRRVARAQPMRVALEAGKRA
jgi:hypothetical protein